MASKKKESEGERALKEGETRRFRCIRGCYWDNTRWRSAEESKTGASVIEFTSPGEIPANFQFENWEEF